MATAVFHTAFLGDLLLSIPLFRRLRAINKGEPIVLICRKGFGGFFLHHRLVDEIHEVDKTSPVSRKQLLRSLKGRKFSRLIVPHQSLRSALMTKRLDAAERVAYAEWWNAPFFDIRVDRPMELPEPLRLLALIEGIDPVSAKWLSEARKNQVWHNSQLQHPIMDWGFHIPDDINMFVEPLTEHVRQVVERLHVQRPYVLIAPTSQWRTKKWGADKFADTAVRLLSRGKNVYFIGSRAEADEVNALVQTIRSPADRIECRSLAGTTDLVTLHSLMAGADAVIANDSGPMHMASAAGVRAIGIFGPTTLSLGFRPWSDKARVAQHALDCRPCGKHGHNECPIKTHACMRDLSAHDVERLVLYK